jgi:RNA polymerase sigma-70 factor (ECF subfamily)
MNDRALDRLFRRFRERHDGAALAAVFDATSRELFDVACHLIRDPAEAEDLVQATFLTAIAKAKDYEGGSPVKGWLYGILWREGANARRSAALRADPARLADVARNDSRRATEPFEGLVAAEVPLAVARALEKLPSRYREVLDPLIRDGQPAEEIARALRRSPGTVRSQIHRGLERLRRSLPDDLVPLSGVALVSVRGLTKVRGEVLQAAGFSPAVAAAAPALALSASIGGVLMTKSVILGGAAAIAIATVAWFAYEERPSGVESEISLASSTEDRVETPDRSGEVPAVLTAGSREDSRSQLEPSGDPVLPVSLQEEIDAWLARFNEAPEDWRHGWDVAGEIAKLPPDRALAIMTAVWPKLSVPVREQALKPFVFGGGHPHALKLLDIAARDPEISVQGRAFLYLKSYAFQDFASDYEAYLRWSQSYRDLPLKEALTQNAERFVADLRAMSPADLAQRIRTIDRLDLQAGGPADVDLAAVMRDAGGLQALSTCLEGNDADAKRCALRWSKSMHADETWLRTWVLPAIDGTDGSAAGDPELLGESFEALARPDCAWAQGSILEHLRRASAVGPLAAEPNVQGEPQTAATVAAGTMSAARALAEIGDPAAIPGMIEVLLHDRSGRLGYDVGYFGLAKLTGVRWQKEYDGAWWLDWWEKNSRRLPPEVQAIPIRR